MTVDGVQHSKASETGSGAWAHITSIPDANTLVLEAAIPSGAWVGYTGGDLIITKIEGTGCAHMDGIQLYRYMVTPIHDTIIGNTVYNLGKYTWSNIQGLWIGGEVGYPTDYITVENNLIYSHRTDSARTVGTWGPVTHLVFRNNTVATTRSVEFNTQTQADAVTGNLVYNLSFVRTLNSVDCNLLADAATVVDCNDNIVRQMASRMCIPFPGYGSHNVVTGSDVSYRALFNNYDANDFTLAVGSSAINFGDVNYAPVTDILGNPRDSQPDAGAYEYISSTSSPSIIYGDINSDGVVSPADALLAAQYSLGLTTLTSDQITKGDVSNNGQVTVYDAALILQKVAGVITKFPVE
jgi:hypothetical protein